MGILKIATAALVSAAFPAAKASGEMSLSSAQSSTSPLNIEARYFDDRTGAFSENVLGDDKPYRPWNLGMRAAPERQGLWGAGDLLITIRVDTGKLKGPTPTEKVSVRVMAKGRTLGFRTTSFTRNSGTQYFPLMLQDATCAGVVEVIASVGGVRRSATLSLACGE